MTNGTSPPDPHSPPLSASPPPRSLSAQGLAFIRKHEGYSAEIYQDSAGNPTIGYGHLIRSSEDFSGGITQQQAFQLLSDDTKAAVDAVNRRIKVSLNQTQFDALVDFTFNLGALSLGKSILLHNINSGSPVVLKNFSDWNHTGGNVIHGLTVRRTAEFNLFSNGDYGA